GDGSFRLDLCPQPAGQRNSVRAAKWRRRSARSQRCRSVFAPVVSPDSPFSRGADRQRRQSAACSSKVMPGQAARIYTDKDAELRWLKGKTCAVIGFGAQGRAHALNLRDNGMKVIVGL